jgi:hypothetical protein
VGYFVDRNGSNTPLLVLLTRVEIAIAARDIMIENLMLRAIGEPDPSLLTGTEDRDAWNARGGGEVHWAAIMADVK